MRFGNLISVSTILHLFLHWSFVTVSHTRQQQLDTLWNTSSNIIVSNPIADPSANIYRRQSQQPSAIRLLSHPRQRLNYHLNKYRRPDRRLFFSFNQFLLSMVAPRLMRYQFDLMMHSVVSELFKKILMPAIGTASGESNSIFSSIGSLLRFRQNAPRTATVTATAATTAPASAPQPNLDVQRLLDNAQKLITLQKLLRNNGNDNHNNNNRHNHPSANRGINSIVSAAAVADPANNNGINKIGLTDNQTDRLNSSASQSKSNTKSDHPIHFAISTKEFINFIQNNLKLNPSAAKSNNNTELSRNANRNTNKDLHIPASFDNNQQMSSSSRFVNPNFESSIKANTESNIFETFGHKERKFEDFKMSHLAYIDTEVPNYGNQLLTGDPDSPYNNNQDNDDFKNSLESKNQFGLIDSTMLSEKEPNNLKSDDLERANRWNNVLVNMNRINEQQSG